MHALQPERHQSSHGLTTHSGDGSTTHEIHRLLLSGLLRVT